MSRPPAIAPGWQRGWPVLAAIADFWTSVASPVAGGYAVKHVQPPDEDHPDVDNSAYTNAAAALAIRHAIDAAASSGRGAMRAGPTWQKA